MKTNFKLIVSGCILSLMLSATSCNKQRPENLQNIEATPELQAALFDLYPEAQDVKWSQKNSYYVADFKAPAGVTPEVRSDNGDLVNYSAWFDAQYQWQMTEEDLPQYMIPDAVWAAFDATEYADWRIDDIDMLRRGGVETIYIIEVEGTTADGVHQEVDLYFSEDGVLVKTVIDAEEDYDYWDYIPDTPSGSIEEFIAANYPGARIVDIDIEDGMTEVEIIDTDENGAKVCRELFFDYSQNWMFTRTEMRPGQVPDDIMGYLEASEYGDYWIDDVDFYETPEGEFYRFDLEFHDDDIKVDVYADGTVAPFRGNGDNPGGGNGGMVDGSIEEFIADKYPGARIIEQDWDDGYLEVEIWHDGKEKDVYFNGAGEWVWSQWDVRISELPEAVTSALSKEYPDYRIDDAEYIQTPESEYYLIELEGRGDSERNVRITSDGTIL